jgi:putative SOS response-associated peptidase YedK
MGGSGPLAFFAGICTEWTSVRKLKDGETTDQLFGFLTTDANSIEQSRVKLSAIHIDRYCVDAKSFTASPRLSVFS